MIVIPFPFVGKLAIHCRWKIGIENKIKWSKKEQKWNEKKRGLPWILLGGVKWIILEDIATYTYLKNALSIIWII